MPYVPAHLRTQATAAPEPPTSNPFGGQRQARAAPDEMPSAFASSRKRTDDPHANPSAFAWGKPRESRDVVPLEPTKLQAAPTSEKNPKVIKSGGEDGPVIEIYANGAMSAQDTAPVQPTAKPSGYVPPAQRTAAAAAPKTYEELFPSLGGGAGAPASAPKAIKFNAPSSAGRSWAAIAQDDSIRQEAIRKQEEDRQAAYEASTNIRLNLDDIANSSWAALLDDSNDAPYCYDYNA